MVGAVIADTVIVNDIATIMAVIGRVLRRFLFDKVVFWMQ